MAGERCSRSQMRCSGSGCDADQVSPARTRTPRQLRQLRQLQAQSPPLRAPTSTEMVASVSSLRCAAVCATRCCLTSASGQPAPASCCYVPIECGLSAAVASAEWPADGAAAARCDAVALAAMPIRYRQHELGHRGNCGSCVNYRPSRRRCVRRHRRRWSRLCIELALCRRVCYALLPHIGVGAASASELLLRANRVRPICCMQSQASDVTGLWNGRRTMQPQPDAMQWLWL